MFVENREKKLCRGGKKSEIIFGKKIRNLLINTTVLEKMFHSTFNFRSVKTTTKVKFNKNGEVEKK